MTAEDKNIIVISGPNGAGKSTVAPSLLKDFLAVNEFVNAWRFYDASDVSPRLIAKGLANKEVVIDKMLWGQVKG